MKSKKIEELLKKFREKFGVRLPTGSEFEVGIIGNWKTIEQWLIVELNKMKEEK